MNKSLLRVIILLLCAAILPGMGFAARADGSSSDRLGAGALTEVELVRGAAAFVFVPPTNSVYDFYVFPMEPGDAPVTAELWQGRSLIARGTEGLPRVSARLSAGLSYTLALYGEGRVRVEIDRHALSRCFDQPLMLNAASDEYSKSIARAGDAHWYAVDATSDRPIVLGGIPEAAGLRLRAELFDENGHLLAEASRTTGGAFIMDFAPEPGRRYRARISATEGGTGLYALRVRQGESGALPDVLILSESELILEGRQTVRLTAALRPADAVDFVFWESSDRLVARVDADGTITGRREGTAVISAYGAGGVTARCRVEVTHVDAAGVRLLTPDLALGVGDSYPLEWQVLPENASRQRLDFSVEPGEIAQVDHDGLLTALSEGTASVIATTRDGGFTDRLTLTVGPAKKRCRALLVGEQNYAATVASERPGSANSVAAIRGMLGELSDSGARFQVETRLDVSRDGVLAAVRDTFAGASQQDMCLFYITCHGYYANGMTHFQMYDGSVLTAAELELALRAAPGQVLVIVDCCGSGGVIGRASAPEDILAGIRAAFDGAVGPATLCGSRYRVLASAALEQDSYRISFNAEATETDMATVFARALCEAGGWDLERAARGPMRADADYDGVVTLNELYRYTARRVMWYLNLAGGRRGQENAFIQTVQVWPEGDAAPVFTRTEGE